MDNWKVIGDSYNAAVGEVHNPGSMRLPYGRTSDFPAGQIDEMLNGDGHINPHWRAFMQALDTLGLAEMATRDEEVKRLLRENGVTYVLHGEQQGIVHGNLIPFRLSSRILTGKLFLMGLPNGQNC